MSDGDISVCSSSVESEDESKDKGIPLNPLGLDRLFGKESATESLFRLSELGSKGGWPGSHIPSQLPTFLLQGCP